MRFRKKLAFLYIVIIMMPPLIFGLSTASINNRIITTLKTEFLGGNEFFENQTEHRFINDYKKTLNESITLATDTEYLQLIFNNYRDLSEITITDNDVLIYQNSKVIQTKRVMLSDSLTFETDAHYIEAHIVYPEFTAPERIFRKIFFERAIISLVFYLLLHSIFILVVTKRTLTDSKKLTDIANNIGQGNYDFEFDTSRKDEIGDVYKAFDNMRNSLLTYENNRKELITNISHDLKTPIATIKGYVTGINDGLASTPEKMDKYLNIIYNNTMHLDELINDLFLYSKLDVDQLNFDFKPLHFDKYIDYYIDELKLDLEEKNIDVKWEIPSIDDCIILGDGFRLKRVLNNIVSNAQKHFNKTNNILSFNLTKENNKLLLCITDNGKGIPPEHIDQIFDRFYRADASRNTSTGSSGLGLAIVKQIVEKHSGSLSVVSRLNHYTKITIALPLLGENHG